jgi:hypothetical protein
MNTPSFIDFVAGEEAVRRFLQVKDEIESHIGVVTDFDFDLLTTHFTVNQMLIGILAFDHP